MIEAAYNLFFRLLSKLISLLGILFYCFIKVINPIHDMLDVGKTWFFLYHLHYKDKFVGNPTWVFICATNCLYFLHHWSNLLAAFFFTYNSSLYIAEPSLVTKKEELPRIFLHLLSCLPLLPFLLSSLMLSKMRLAIFEYLVMLKCATIFES